VSRLNRPSFADSLEVWIGTLWDPVSAWVWIGTLWDPASAWGPSHRCRRGQRLAAGTPTPQGGPLGCLFTLGQHRCVPHIAGGELRRPDLQRLLVNSDMYLPPDPAFGAAVFARVPLPFALDLNAGAVDQQLQRHPATRARGCRPSGPPAVGSGC
jgi:hypothetical protein